MSVPVHNSTSIRILGYQRKTEVGNLREFGLNLTPESVWGLLETFRPARRLNKDLTQVEGNKIMLT